MFFSANFALPLSTNMPGSMEHFDEVFFVELSRDDAERYLNPVRSNRGSNAYSQDASARGWGSTSHNQRQGRSNVSDKQSSSSNAPAEKISRWRTLVSSCPRSLS
uniref:Uncharacterized protein n=1 Tax=Aegilops tauschii subsp. strangulata TaxID=200361 RepID=A0A453DAU1_AEGTS